MNALCRFTCFASVVILCCQQASAQPVEISSFGANGQLTVHAPVGSDLNVEWSPDLAGSGHWSDRWDNLVSIHCTNTTMQVNVPMFYRVACFTNGLLWSWKPGTAVFSVSNALGETATQQTKFLGLCYFPEFTNYYGIMYQSGASITDGLRGGTFFGRSDGQSVWAINDPTKNIEVREFFRGPVGMVITNAENKRIAIEAIETVTVPAGTFTNCLKFHKTQLHTSDSHPDYYEWISPGFGTVKWVDYYGGGPGVPVVYQLQSYSNY